MNYGDIKNKTIAEQLREAQLAISDLLGKNTWKMYEHKVYQENDAAEKMFVTQIKTFASNNTPHDLSYKLAEDADTIRKRLRKGDLKIKCDEDLKKDIYSALSKYVGIITIIEAGE